MSDTARLPLSSDQADDIDALREEVRKLRKINIALMDRVERSSDMSVNAFSMFETAISLEAMVRDRTSQLEDALAKLATANADLAEAHGHADAARMRLRDAIDSINEGFVLFDADDRLVLFNEAYLGFWPELAPHVREGIGFADIAKLAAEHLQPLGAAVAPDRWVSDRLAQHGVADGGHVQALADGRWVQINELRTSEGGIVGIYTDITEVKAEDARARALELAERNLILQSTLDTLSEGVCMFDSSRRLSAWNGALGRLLGVSGDPERAFSTHDGFLKWCRGIRGMDDRGCLEWRPDDSHAAPVSQLCPAGDRSFEIRSTRTVQGGQVFSFTDVTDMLRAQAALQETAETLERRVSERTAELLEVNERLGHEVAERRAMEVALTEAKTSAEKANLSKTSFLAAASHDLLQPLNAARLFVAALGDKRLALPTRALVSQTSTALDSVEDLLEALLEISRLDAGAIQPEVSHFRIDQLLQTLNVEFTPMARAAGLAFRIETEQLWVETDVRLLRRILQNFISNAIRYTHAGSVSVCCAVEEGRVAVHVADTGRGIAKEQQALIFEEFRRLDTRSQGKGLGLAIVRRAADMLGHDIRLRSAPGQGSTFSITLPLGRPIDDAATDGGGATRDRSMRGLRVLVVDNERQIQSGMRTLLNGWGCEVVTAGDYAEAVKLFPDGVRPDIILADYHLNDGETGDRVVAQLHAHFGAAVPAVMISADRGEALKTQLAATGIALLNKPVKPAQLRSLLRTMLP
ncbi:PAS-domain containing protein [Sphingobium phenoxybenzoativorans]|uniref:histidine kinase n=1 Tax=Sphingobium phenoxybenzoativorans TaxID=1592790 RepID=A0A975Q1M0_9SPHN|nr:NahK/ErcS family hybrid sensor histidine kinase/response regulator [Sphingobium phenoxybenzoativorans]QUT05801.1 PAS-domain containing protein [Sphingobium phenoxybenzoativorans]